MRLVESPGSVRVHVPMELKRRSGRKQIVLPEAEAPSDGAQPAAAEPTDSRDIVVLTLARAFRWKRLLEEGRFASIAEMAAALGINRWYMSRLIRLTLLAPETIERIVSRTNTISLEMLRKPMPMTWEKQRQWLAEAASGASRRFGQNMALPTHPHKATAPLLADDSVDLIPCAWPYEQRCGAL